MEYGDDHHTYDRNAWGTQDSDARRNASNERPPAPSSHQAPPPYQDPQPGPSSPPPQPSPTPPPRKDNKLLKALGIGCAVMLAVNALIISLSIVAVVVGAVACSASCSDAPTHDARADSDFIRDKKATDRDLVTFDALRGSIEALHDEIALDIARNGDDGTGEETHKQLITVDELRSLVGHGTWPDKSAGYNTVDSARNPQLWIRIAELSEDHIEEATDEDWAIVDFAYPFSSGSSAVPVPYTRDETDHTTTVLVCRNGEDEGLYAKVYYWRWENPARFEVAIDEARNTYAERVAASDAYETSGLLGGRRFILELGELYVWAQGPDDPLLEADAFVEFANSLASVEDTYLRVNLLAADTPTMLGFTPYSGTYPNKRASQSTTFEACRDAIHKGNHLCFLDSTPADVLYTVYRSQDRACTVDDLGGTYAPGISYHVSDKWQQPDYGSVMSDELAKLVFEAWPDMSEDQLIPILHEEYRAEGELTYRVWLIMPRGALPETPQEYCAAVNAVRDHLWEMLFPGIEGEERHSLYVHVFVIDEESIREEIVLEDGMPGAEGEDATNEDEGEGETAESFEPAISEQRRSFQELSDAARTDVGGLQRFKFDVLLGGEASATQWSEEWRLNRFDCTPDEVGGSIARTRAWRFGTTA